MVSFGNLFILTKVLFKFMIYKITRRCNKALRNLGKGKYEVVYYINDKMYRFRTCVRRGPHRITRIRDRQGMDVTNDVNAFLGPNEDCHRQKLSPNDIGYDGLYLFFRGNVGTYVKAKEVIDIDNLYKKTVLKIQ